MHDKPRDRQSNDSVQPGMSRVSGQKDLVKSRQSLLGQERFAAKQIQYFAEMID